ncbi:MAG: bis(5'-nucleosyl)-tetraphosphatase (symmetrical) YqeK [Peptostreptococcaceae bacterium]|nr:bis(5'-nucleosyl)-tetraphosphatase (symmetrical) YqeK [Peptostreptococcaceae bacterium]
MNNQEDLVFWLAGNLKKSRFKHVMGVLEVAIELAEAHGVSKDKAETAALFHDYAKNFSDDEMRIYVDKQNLRDEHLSICGSINLYHGIVGASIAEKKYGVKDRDVLNAIMNHTFGRTGMSKLEKIIYLADIMEISRDFEGVDEIREKAFSDLDQAILAAIDKTLLYLIGKGEVININTIYARNDLISGNVKGIKKGGV